jgi:hypothetical protein
MTKREKIRQRGLDEAEAEFYPLLIQCLRMCARGRWGLFSHQLHRLNALERESYVHWINWPERLRLQQLAEEIQGLRAELGGDNKACERFLALCELKGSSVPGEPKLAAEFLAELGEQEV